MKTTVTSLTSSIVLISIILTLFVAGMLAGLVVLANRLTSTANDRVATINGVAELHYSISSANPNHIIITTTETGLLIDAIEPASSIVCNGSTYIPPACYPSYLVNAIVTIENEILQENATANSLTTTVEAQAAQITSLQSVVSNLNVMLTNLNTQITRLALSETNTTDIKIASGNATYTVSAGATNVLNGWGNVTIYTRSITLAIAGTNTTFFFIQVYPTSQGSVFTATSTSVVIQILMPFYPLSGGGSGSSSLIIPAQLASIQFVPPCPTCLLGTSNGFLSSTITINILGMTVGQTYTLNFIGTVDFTVSFA